jgi:GNAT superfamily N-acetyltransferase
MTVDYLFTEYEEADYEAIVQIAKAVQPDDFESVEDLSDWDANQRRAGRRSLRWQAAVEGKVIGYGSVSQSPWFERAVPFGNVMVRPDHQHRGIGRGLLERLEATARDLAARTLLTYTQEDRPRAMRFLEAAGYEEYDRQWRSTLDLASFDPDRWRNAVDRVASSGLRVASIAELRETVPDWVERLYDLYSSVEKDVPTPLPVQSVPAAEFETLSLGRKLIAEGFLVALDGDEFVGLTEPQRVEEHDDVIAQNMTGVAAPARGKGIATALKVTAATWAKENGYRSIRTYNNQSNAPMLAVNDKLGFVRDFATVEYGKDL